MRTVWLVALAACASTRTIAVRPAELQLVDRQGHHYAMLLGELTARCENGGTDDALCGYPDITRATVEARPPSEPSDHGDLYRDAILVGAAGLVTCTIACGSPYNYISAGVIVSSAVVALGAVFWLFAAHPPH